MATRPEEVISLLGVDTVTQAAIQSDEEEFYGSRALVDMGHTRVGMQSS